MPICSSPRRKPGSSLLMFMDSGFRGNDETGFDQCFRKSMLLRLLAIAWLLLAPFCWAAEGEAPIALPSLQARVTDLTGTLTAEQQATLESALAAIEQAKGAQVAILLLPSTAPEAIEQFGIRLAEAWKLGRKGIDDGVILIVAKEDRRLRLDVGYGLEGALNDATAKRIISEVIVPRFKQGDYFGGLESGVVAVRSVIEGEALPPPASGGAASGLAGLGEGGLWVLLAVGALGGALLRTVLGNLLGSSLVAGAGGVVGWLFFASLGGVLMGVVGGFLLALFGLDIGMALLSNRGRGFGSGGGGFRGGGGGFGGGGASGGW